MNKTKWAHISDHKEYLKLIHIKGNENIIIKLFIILSIAVNGNHNPTLKENQYKRNNSFNY